MVIISGKLTRPIQFTDEEGNEKSNVYVELYTYMPKSNDTQNIINQFKLYKIYFDGKNIERLKKLNLVKWSALTIIGHIHNYPVLPTDIIDFMPFKGHMHNYPEKIEENKPMNYIVIEGTSFFPTLMSGNTTIVNMTGRLASKKVVKKDNIIFDVAVDYLKKKNNANGRITYTIETEFIPCIAYNTAQNQTANIIKNMKIGYLLLINGSLSSKRITYNTEELLRIMYKINVNDVHTLSKTEEENAKYKKIYNLP